MAIETKTNNPTVQAAIGFLRDQFDQFDERWIIGHKGDHAKNLQNLGVIDARVDVAHVHSTLGVKADRIISPPPGSSSSYEALLTAINPGMGTEVRRVVDTNRRVVILMPFPNAGIEQIVAAEGAQHQFVSTAPVSDFASFEPIEDKISFSRMLEEVFGRTPYKRNIIPWTVYQPGRSLVDLRNIVSADREASLFMQIALSGGGDGTLRIDTEQQFAEMMQNSNWVHAAQTDSLKVTRTVENAYPANGTGCILPTAEGDCKVLVDPLSHKPVGSEKLNILLKTGVGNDWSEPFPQGIQNQYIDMITAIGKHLYRQYGYTGIFGPDGLVGPDGDTSQSLYQLTEINSRWQGTTPYQTQNALMNGRLPLELVHYMTKLANGDKKALRTINELVGDADDYNQKAVAERGGYYIKIFAPAERQTIKQDINGAWIWDGSDFRRVPADTKIDLISTYNGSFDRLQIQASESDRVLWIKAPGAGETIGGELAPIGFLTGSGKRVFEIDRPDITPEVKQMYDRATSMMYHG